MGIARVSCKLQTGSLLAICKEDDGQDEGEDGEEDEGDERGNIQETFEGTLRKRLGNIEETFGEH
jgi:hypothetical protein